ncbi:MAG TPA: malto-oligosyltrehalose trehalohydrolase [Stellaceae bacterium]|jgi:malto-oligosyltrehalose trehalohydrolase|nr:malto-oligosyltrehalose trehalohydrolase [Stellaceae bacterium]
MRRAYRSTFGATPQNDGTKFRLYAPKAHQVALRLEGHDRAMTRNGDWFELTAADAKPGMQYGYVIDGAQAVPDPASRFQPQDVNGPSEIVAPDAFDWTDDNWRGRPWREAVLYELHLGTFTRAGGYRAAMTELERLRDLGITAIELMPLADFAGARNWGYDGVLPFAPDSSYGRPEDLKALICAAHRLGIMVFVDVVYNHFGPEGNYLSLYAPNFFAPRETGWGRSLDFGSIARRFFIENALYWLIEYHIDGLRFDAVHAIHDESETHFLDELAQAARQACGDRHIHLVLENDQNEAHLLERDNSGEPRLYDAQWNDDFHHAMHVVLTGESDGYYGDYAASPVEHLGRTLAQGFAYQGEHSPFRDDARGEPSAHLPPGAFVNFLQNHDQVGNRAFGERLVSLVPREALQAAIAIQLLAPSPPLLFMGEEVGATTPFLFFCDFAGDLANAVREGRRREFARFPAFASPDARERIPDPLLLETFTRSNIAPAVAHPDREIAALYKQLLELRRREIVPRLTGTHPTAARYRCEGRGLSVEWDLPDGTRLMLIANLAAAAAEPLAKPLGQLIWGAAPQTGPLVPWTALWSIGAQAKR